MCVCVCVCLRVCLHAVCFCVIVCDRMFVDLWVCGFVSVCSLMCLFWVCVLVVCAFGVCPSPRKVSEIITIQPLLGLLLHLVLDILPLLAGRKLGKTPSGDFPSPGVLGISSSTVIKAVMKVNRDGKQLTHGKLYRRICHRVKYKRLPFRGACVYANDWVRFRPCR